MIRRAAIAAVFFAAGMLVGAGMDDAPKGWQPASVILTK